MGYGRAAFHSRRAERQVWKPALHAAPSVWRAKEIITVDSFGRTPRRLAKPWRGTFVGIVLDLNNPLPLEHVYAEAEEMVVPAELIVPSVAAVGEPAIVQPEGFALRLNSLTL